MTLRNDCNDTIEETIRNKNKKTWYVLHFLYALNMFLKYDVGDESYSFNHYTWCFFLDIIDIRKQNELHF